MPTRESHPIPNDKLNSWREASMDYFRKVKGQYDIEKILRDLSPEEPYLVLPEELALVYALRYGTCLYLYFTDLLMDRTGQREEAKTSGGMPTPSILRKARFASAYSVFVMANAILQHCEKTLKGKDPAKLAQFDASSLELVAGKTPKNDLSFLLSSYVEALMLASKEKTIEGAADTIAVTKDFWKEVVKKSIIIVKESPELLDLIANTTFHHSTFAVTGLQAEERGEVKVISWAPVQRSEVVGDHDVTLTIIRQCQRLALYDAILQKNPVNYFGGLLESILFDGLPGTGKTIRFRLMMTEVSRLAEMVGLPFLFKSITADQVKSEWYGKTAQLIGELLKSVTDPGLLALCFVDDIDLLLSGDRGAQGVSGADLDLMKALMDFFSGIGTNYTGNYLAAAATNKPTATDDALRQRFVYRAVILGPKTKEDYSDIVALELHKFAKTGLLQIGKGKYEPLKRAIPNSLAEIYSDDIKRRYGKYNTGTWDDPAALAEELKKKDARFTGRSIKNAIQVAVAQAADFDIPEEWFVKPEVFRSQPWERRLDMLKTLYKPLTADTIMMALEHQFEVEQRYRREAYEKRVTDYADELTVRLKAQDLITGKK